MSNSKPQQRRNHYIRLGILGLLTACLAESIAPKAALAWTTSVDEAGWYADAGFPAGAPVNNNLPYIWNPPSNFSTIGGMLSGSGLALTHTTHTLSGSTYTVFEESNVAATSYNNAVTNQEYIYSSLTVSTTSPSVRISAYTFNQMQMDASRNFPGAQMVLALYDVTAGTLTQILQHSR